MFKNLKEKSETLLLQEISLGLFLEDQQYIYEGSSTRVKWLSRETDFSVWVGVHYVG